MSLTVPKAGENQQFVDSIPICVNSDLFLLVSCSYGVSIEPSHGLVTVAIPEDAEERLKTHLTPLDTWSLTGQHFIPSLADSMFSF